MKKKILSLILCALMITTMLVSASAEEATQTNSVCGHYNAVWTGGGGIDDKIMTCPDCELTVTFKPSTSLPKGGNDATDGVQAVYLTTDVIMTKKEAASFNTTYYVDLNGHTITQQSLNPVFVLNKGITYHLFDSSADKTGKLLVADNIEGRAQAGSGFTAIAACSQHYYSGTSEFNMYGGTIEGWGNEMLCGGAVFLSGIKRDEGETPDSITFNMFGGTIKDCNSWQGGAIAAFRGAVVNIYGGTITGNKAVRWNEEDGGGGAAIRGSVDAEINIYGGEFTNNVARNSEMIRLTTDATLKISGGRFDVQPEGSWIVTGYEMTQETIEEVNFFVVRKQTFEQVEGDVTHHIATMDNAVAATCTEDGHETDWECLDTDCDYVKKGKILPATGHTDEVIPAKAPDCEKDGATKGKKCSVCGEILTAPESVPATGHTPGAWTVFEPASIGRKGEERQKCTDCNKTLEKREIPALEPETQAKNETTTEDKGSDEKTGCGAVVGSSAVVLAVTLGLGVTAVLKKRKD